MINMQKIGESAKSFQTLTKSHQTVYTPLIGRFFNLNKDQLLKIITAINPEISKTIVLIFKA